MHIINCPNCLNNFSSLRTNTKYCSISCSNKFRLLGKGKLQIISCPICNTLFKPARTSRQFCSNACSSQHKTNDPTFIANLKLGCSKRSQNPIYLQKLSDKANERWNSIDFRRKMEEIYTSDEFSEKSNETYLTKDYYFPSGKHVRVQGYEPKALDILLQTYNEEDLIVGSMIKHEVGIITYIDDLGNLRRYNPDIYVKTINMIIEVKSKWTYNVNLDSNLKKKQACENLGINFEFMIL